MLKLYFMLNPMVEVFLWWGLALVAVVVYLWWEKRKREKITIPFSSFRSFYEVSEEGWNVDGFTPVYRKDGKVFRLSFSIPEYFLFLRWRRNKRKEGQKKEAIQKGIQFTNYIRSDIRNSFPNITIKK